VGDLGLQPMLDVRAQHSEGPCWDAASQRLWWVDITGCRVHCFDPASGADTSWVTAGQPGGVLIDRRGEPIIGMPGGLTALDRASGQTRSLASIEADLPGNRLNDMKADSSGRVWAGSMAYERTPRAGSLHRVDPGSEGQPPRAARAVGHLTISNGPAIDEAAGRLYLADTAAMVVDLFDLDPATAALSGRRRFLDFTQGGVWPDGMTVDDEGCLWLALGRSGQVRRYLPDATLDAVIELPVTNPTSVAFGGRDGRDLFITTSWFDLTPDQRQEQPLAGAIFIARPEVSGPASPRCALLGGLAGDS
jgi:sugar lactone lactonase YvrE